MGGGEDVESDERLVQAVERLTRINVSIAELNREATQIRTRIRDFDVNVEALSMLAGARSRDEKGGGEQVLRDVIRYARQMGTHLEIHERGAPLAPAPRAPDDAAMPRPEGGGSTERTGERVAAGPWKVLTQVAMALALTTGLFALIH